MAGQQAEMAEVGAAAAMTIAGGMGGGILNYIRFNSNSKQYWARSLPSMLIATDKFDLLVNELGTGFQMPNRQLTQAEQRQLRKEMRALYTLLQMATGPTHKDPATEAHATVQTHFNSPNNGLDALNALLARFAATDLVQLVNKILAFIAMRLDEDGDVGEYIARVEREYQEMLALDARVSGLWETFRCLLLLQSLPLPRFKPFREDVLRSITSTNADISWATMTAQLISWDRRQREDEVVMKQRALETKALALEAKAQTKETVSTTKPKETDQVLAMAMKIGQMAFRSGQAKADKSKARFQRKGEREESDGERSDPDTSDGDLDMDTCWNCFSNKHFVTECKRPKRKCYDCGQMGHVKKYCKAMKEWRRVSAFITLLSPVPDVSYELEEDNYRNTIWCLVDNCSQVHMVRHEGLLRKAEQIDDAFLFTATGPGAKLTKAGSVVLDIELAPPSDQATTAQAASTKTLPVVNVHVVPDLPALMVLSGTLMEEQGWVMMEGQCGLRHKVTGEVIRLGRDTRGFPGICNARPTFSALRELMQMEASLEQTHAEVLAGVQNGTAILLPDPEVVIAKRRRDESGVPRGVHYRSAFANPMRADVLKLEKLLEEAKEESEALMQCKQRLLSSTSIYRHGICAANVELHELMLKLRDTSTDRAEKVWGLEARAVLHNVTSMLEVLQSGDFSAAKQQLEEADLVTKLEKERLKTLCEEGGSTHPELIPGKHFPYVEYTTLNVEIPGPLQMPDVQCWSQLKKVHQPKVEEWDGLALEDHHPVLGTSHYLVVQVPEWLHHLQAHALACGRIITAFPVPRRPLHDPLQQLWMVSFGGQQHQPSYTRQYILPGTGRRAADVVMPCVEDHERWVEEKLDLVAALEYYLAHPISTVYQPPANKAKGLLAKVKVPYMPVNCTVAYEDWAERPWKLHHPMPSSSQGAT